MSRRYLNVIELKSFEERFEYLKLNGVVAHSTFGGHRYLNQMLYRCPEWKSTRDKIIIRDECCDLAHPDRSIYGRVLVHHIEPITVDDILQRRQCVFDLNNLICVSFETHNALHYGDADQLPKDYVARSPNDTCPWR